MTGKSRAMDENMASMMRSAILMENTGLLSELISGCDDLYARCEIDFSPLNFAVRRKNEASIEVLLRSGFDPSAPAKVDCEFDVLVTPLCVAVSNSCDIEIIRSLILAGADVDRRAATGPAVVLAAVHERMDAVRLLVESGCNVNLPDANGYTAIQEACAFLNAFDIARYLAANGAKVSQVKHMSLVGDGFYSELKTIAESAKLKRRLKKSTRKSARRADASLGL